MPLLLLVLLLTHPSRKLVVTLMLLFALAIPWVRYVHEGAYYYVYSSELKSTEFLAEKIKPSRDVFTHRHLELLWYYEPGPKMLGISDWRYWLPVSPLKVPLSALDGLQYIVISQYGTNTMKWIFGADPFSDWPNTESGRLDASIYDNGAVQIYDNRQNPISSWQDPLKR